MAITVACVCMKSYRVHKEQGSHQGRLEICSSEGRENLTFEVTPPPPPSCDIKKLVSIHDIIEIL